MKKKSRIIFTGILFLSIVMNIIAWNSTAFCDWYVEHIFPWWIQSYGRLTGYANFSVGEVMIAIGVLLLTIGIVTGFIAVIFYLAGILCKKRKGIRIQKFCICYFKGVAWIALVVFVIMTLNCFPLYHTSSLQDKYYPDRILKDYYTQEELKTVRDYIVRQCNRLSLLVERNEEGEIIYTKDMEQTAIEAMQNLGKQYSQLEGFYPRPKQIKASEFLSQQYMQGYFFPFSMEANYNNVMKIMNKPSTMCHELAHLKGFIYEDEANLIGFLACIESDDVLFQYSGYLSVLNYIDNDYYASIGKNKKEYLASERISPMVSKDNKFLSEEAWESVEAKAVMKTETVNKISDEILDATLVMNGVEDGIQSYNRVVNLMLDYYSYEYMDEISILATLE